MRSISNEALYVNDDRNLFVLYNPIIAQQGFRKFSLDIVVKSILGAITIRNNTLYRVSEVERIAAEHGWGPLMYMIAANFSPNGLTANRTPQVSDDAKAVWQKFYHGQLTHKEPLHPDAHHHAEDFLNQRYRLLGSLSPVIRTAIQRSMRLIGRDENGDKKNLLEEAADMYMREKIDDIYS